MSGWFIDNFNKIPAKTAADKRALGPKWQHRPVCGYVLDIKFKQVYFGMVINNQVSALQHDLRNIR